MAPNYRAWVQHFLDIFIEEELLKRAKREGDSTTLTRKRKLCFTDVFYAILDVGRETTSHKLDRFSRVLYKGTTKGKTKRMKVSQQGFS